MHTVSAGKLQIIRRAPSLFILYLNGFSLEAYSDFKHALMALYEYRTLLAKEAN